MIINPLRIAGSILRRFRQRPSLSPLRVVSLLVVVGASLVQVHPSIDLAPFIPHLFQKPSDMRYCGLGVTSSLSLDSTGDTFGVLTFMGRFSLLF